MEKKKGYKNKLTPGRNEQTNKWKAIEKEETKEGH